MYEHLIDGMVKAIMEKMEVESGYFDVKIKEALVEFWSDKLVIIWNTEDVIEYAADSMDTVLTERDAKEVLGRVMQDLDAGEGVDWGTIEYHANMLIHENRAANEDFADDWLANHDAMEGK